MSFKVTQIINHENNNKCSILSETTQEMPIKIVMRIVRLKVYIIFSQSRDLYLHSRSQLRLKRDTVLTCTIIVVYLTMLSYGI